MEVFRACPCGSRTAICSYRTGDSRHRAGGRRCSRLLDADLHAGAPCRADGLLLTDYLAQMLDVRLGDS